MMKRSLIALAVASVPFTANAADVSGFVDITGTNDNEDILFAANAEVDVRNKMDNVTVGLDADLALGGDAPSSGSNAGLSGPADSAVIEQAFFAMDATSSVTVMGGVFNNPIGWEAEDAPGLYQISHGQIYGILDGQTALYGNNVAGVAGKVNAGMASVTVGVLNDLGLNPDSDGKLQPSYAVAVNATPMGGLDLELGYATQEAGAENVLDVNATYAAGPATVGFEFLQADKVVDSAYGLTVNYMITNAIGATLVYDSVAREAATAEDSVNTTVAVSYAAAKNLTVLAEVAMKTNVDGADGEDDDVATLEFVATF